MKLQVLDIVVFIVSSLLLIQPCSCHDAPVEARHSNNTISNTTRYQTIDASNSTNPPAVPLAAGTRPVYLVMHVRLTGAQTFPPTYEKLFPAYASLHFNGSSTDGPLEIQVVNKKGQDLIRVTDWGVHNNDKPMGVPQPGYLTDYFELFGKSNATNDQILNASTGKGLVHDVWARNTSLALKAYNSIDFMHACIAQLGLGLAPSDNPSAIIPTRIVLAQTYWRNLWIAEKVVSHYPIWLETLEGWGDHVQKSRAEFNWQAGADPSVGMVQSRSVPVDPVTANSTDSLVDNGMSDLAAPDMTETYQAGNDAIKTAPEYQWIYAQPASQNKILKRDPPTVVDQVLVYQPGENDYPVIGQRLEDGNNNYATKHASTPANEAGAPADGADVVPAPADGASALESEAGPPTNDLLPPADRPDTAVTARTLSQKLLSIVRPAFALASLAGVTAIVIADFQSTNKGDTLICALISILAGFLGMLLLLGPPALSELMMLSAITIGEIPKYTSSAKTAASQNEGMQRHEYASGHWKRVPSAPTPPLRTDVRGILQYTIVGDRNQTGNENCLSKGYKDCTIVYGPYLLAAALQIETFDAFALLIHYNEGYPMAMTDLVEAFTLATDLESANQVATIDCSHSTKPNDRFSWSNPNQATILNSCDKPIFSIKRQLINLPILNQTSDQIYGRLMPQGNCTLVGDVSGGEKYPAYNMTIIGGAVAIACGIMGAINVNGTGEPLLGVQLNNPSLAANHSVPLSIVSPGNQSSDGSSGRAYLAPPPAAPFQIALNLTNSICLGAPGGRNLCFPNGTYSSQDGSLGFDSTKANTLSLDVNSSIVITESTIAKSKGIYAHAPAPPPAYNDYYVTYKTNQSAIDTNFAADMQNMIKYKKDNTFTVNVPTEPDAACFYQQPRGKGDFACFGPGGGDFPLQLKGKARSVKAFGRASVEVFANGYGNTFAHIFDTYEDDLAQLPYDKGSSFADVASSMWVFLEPGPLIPTDPDPSEPSASGPSNPGPSGSGTKATT